MNSITTPSVVVNRITKFILPSIESSSVETLPTTSIDWPIPRFVIEEGEMVVLRSSRRVPSASRTSTVNSPLRGIFPSFMMVKDCFPESPRGMNNKGATVSSDTLIPAKLVAGTSTRTMSSAFVNRPLLLPLTNNCKSNPNPEAV